VVPNSALENSEPASYFQTVSAIGLVVVGDQPEPTRTNRYPRSLRNSTTSLRLMSSYAGARLLPLASLLRKSRNRMFSEAARECAVFG
jgi:hypothetical protein